MGTALARLIAEAPDLELVGGIGREAAAPADGPGAGGRIETPEGAGPLIGGADVLLDFSAPEFLARILDLHADALAGRGLVVGTTGLDDAVLRRLDAAAVRGPVLVAANFSVGVNLLLALVERAAALLDADRYDVEIIESHHRRKADAPSGTALALGRAVAAGRGVALDAVRRDGRSGRPGPRPPGEVGFHAVRGGAVVGDHQVVFLGERERLALAHSAIDRSLFAEGALTAARWIAGRAPGHYEMRDALGV